MMSAEVTIRNLLEANPLREPVLREVIQALQLPPGSRGLDIGCGIGLQAMLLAQAAGPGSQVAGLDLAPPVLAYGRNLVEAAGLGERIHFFAGDMHRLPFGDAAFDWAWSADCVGYPVGDLLPALQEMARVVRPGGRLAILAWSSQQLLPGYPQLEAWLNAACSQYAPYFLEVPPEAHFARALGWFRQAGLQAVTASTFAGSIQAPLEPPVHCALASLFEMLWGVRQPELPEAAWREYRRLCAPGSADFILNIPDYYAFFTYTLFQGRVPA